MKTGPQLDQTPVGAAAGAGTRFYIAEWQETTAKGPISLKKSGILVEIGGRSGFRTWDLHDVNVALYP
jgi:hypothetical protein